ncbi:MAG: hypothetical protein B6U73_03010 [Desulfurococcales archaeon ex4484_204]|nr:MAG: hypothetical protein B6U73_03010 [Desulfurococcales archaeon ex4484_204]
MDIDELTRRYYGRLFILPRGRVLALLYLALIAVVGTVNALPTNSPLSVAQSVAQYSILGVTLPIMYSILIATRVFNLKRVVGLSGVMFLASLPAEVVMYRLTGLKGTGILASSGLAFVILNGFYHLMRAFLKTWFTGNPVKLEDALNSYAVEGDLRVKVVAVAREGAEPVMLVFPTVHYGPFRNVGSARFIYHLQERFGPSVKALVFHTAGSHEHNLVSSESSEELAKVIRNSVNNYFAVSAKLGMCKPYRVRSRDGWEVFTLNGPTFVAMFFTNRGRGNDDLPYELWEVAEQQPVPLLIAVADSHSFRGPKVVDVGELMEPLKEALGRYSCVEGEEFYVGYGEGRASLTECRGLCSDVVKALSIRFRDGSRYGLVYIYGNNMDGGYREELESRVRSLGYIDVEVVTPDDHSCAASFKESPYDVVSRCGSLTRAVAEAASEAMASEVRAYYSTMEVVVKGVRYVGSKIYDMLSGLEVIGRRAEELLIILALAVNLAPAVLAAAT